MRKEGRRKGDIGAWDLGPRKVADLGCLAPAEKCWGLQAYQKQAASLACKSRLSIKTSQLQQLSEQVSMKKKPNKPKAVQDTWILHYSAQSFSQGFLFAFPFDLFLILLTGI